jgi:hypothetical protein
MEEIKVGDTIKVISTDPVDEHQGKIGTVTEVDRGVLPYTVEFDEENCSEGEETLECFEREAIELVPPSKFKVGDRVIPSTEYSASIYYGKGILGTIIAIDRFDAWNPIAVKWDDGVTWTCYTPNELTLISVETPELHGHPRFYELTKKMDTTHSAKNKEYTQGGSPTGNFDRTSAIKRLYEGLDWASPVGGCIDYMLKQLDCALWMLAQGYEPEVENYEARMIDVANYSLLSIVKKEEE